MKPLTKNLLIAFWMIFLFNMVFLLTMTPLIGHGLANILMLAADIALYFYAANRLYGFIHSYLMSAATAAFVWLGVWDVKQLIAFIKAWPNPMEAVSISGNLYMILVGVCGAGLYFLGIHYLGEQKKEDGVVRSPW